MRCRWCARFIAKDTVPSVWEVVLDGVWSRREALLCPEDAASSQVALSYWRPVTQPMVSEDDRG